jgi:hypothetical protein
MMACIEEVAKRTGIESSEILSAHWKGKLAEPAISVDGVRLYTETDIRKVKDYFAKKGRK